MIYRQQVCLKTEAEITRKQAQNQRHLHARRESQFIGDFLINQQPRQPYQAPVWPITGAPSVVPSLVPHPFPFHPTRALVARPSGIVSSSMTRALRPTPMTPGVEHQFAPAGSRQSLRRRTPGLREGFSPPSLP